MKKGTKLIGMLTIFTMLAFSGSLSGNVTEYETNELIVGAEITITEVNDSTEFSTVSDEFGAYLFADLELGMYNLIATAEGYDDFYHMIHLYGDGDKTFNIVFGRPNGGGHGHEHQHHGMAECDGSHEHGNHHQGGDCSGDCDGNHDADGDGVCDDPVCEIPDCDGDHDADNDGQCDDENCEGGYGGGHGGGHGGGDNERGNSLGTNDILGKAFPNPFHPTTAISYQLPASSEVRLQIFNMQGQLVETLVNETQNAGLHSVNWNASSMTSGVYFYQITTDNFSTTKKIVLLK